MEIIQPIITLLFFPAGLFVMGNGLAYLWVDRKLVAQYQNRIGPRWFQPLADVVKLLSKEEIVPTGIEAWLFNGLPLLALACALTAAVYVPLVGLQPAWSFQGDLIVTVYLLSVVTMSLALAGANTANRFSLIGAVRTLTQLFSYEAPFMLALLGPALVAGSWQISTINAFTGQHWLILTQPIGCVVALVGLMGKLELPPFDAPEAETEIVKGALTEYGGRGLALFQLAKAVELVVGLTLIAAFYLGGIGNPIEFFVKTLAILLVLAGLQSLFARFRIEQTAKWWRFAALLLLVQWLIIALLGGKTL
ncbi:NADH-quinone oxidoreductase subunit H [Thermoflexales bacterium]|nr:NADH-quinone oxidoreductase subunit H [Thermoflexales bacterium]